MSKISSVGGKYFCVDTSKFVKSQKRERSGIANSLADLNTIISASTSQKKRLLCRVQISFDDDDDTHAATPPRLGRW